MVSIKDVAKDASVSPQTVSNCINNPGIVKPATRALVAESIKRLGYTPNASARRLRKQRSDIIAIGIAPVTGSMVYDRLLHALATEADAQGIRVMLYKTNNYKDEIRQFGALSASGDVDAFILTDTAHDDPRLAWLIEHDQVFVLFGRPWGLSDMYAPNVPWVDVDGRQGIADMTRFLILQGNKRIGFIGWAGVSGTGNDRYEGWREVMLNAKMATEDELGALCAQSNDTFGGGQQACIELMRRIPDLDAIVCVSDTIAVGAQFALTADTGITITGFDNSAAAQSIGLLTVEQPLAASAHEIIRIVQERLAQRDAQHRRTRHDNGDAETSNPAHNAGSPDNDHVMLAPTLILD